MPDLHTLVIGFQSDFVLKRFGRNPALPGLRRLAVSAPDLRGVRLNSLLELRAEGLVELWVQNCQLRTRDVATLLAAKWARGLEVLTFESCAVILRTPINEPF